MTQPDGKDSSHAPPGPPCDRPRILLVEDNPVLQRLMTTLLERDGYLVELVTNGRDALEAFEASRPDLVLMDVQLPVMDGLRAARLLRAREKAVGGHVPIVAVTAGTGLDEKERCLAAGMDECFVKPVQPGELLGALTRLLGKRARGTPEPPAPSVVAPQTVAGPDWLVNLKRNGIGEEGVERLVRAFLDSVPPRLASLRQALTAGDLAAAQLAAHSLRGSLSVFAPQQALDAAKQVPGMGVGAMDEQAVLAPLEAGVERLMRSMQEYLEKKA